MGCNLTPVRMATIKKAKKNKCLRGSRERRTLIHCWWECGTAIIENSMQVPQKVKIELPCDPAIPLLGIYPKEMKSTYQRHMCISSVYCSTVVH